MPLPADHDRRKYVPLLSFGLIQHVWLVDLGCACQAKVFPDSGTMFPVRTCTAHRVAAGLSGLCRSCRVTVVRAGEHCSLCDTEAR